MDSKKETIILVALILVSASLVGLTISSRASGLETHHSRGIIQYGQDGMRSFRDLFGNFSSMTVSLNSTTPNGSEDSLTTSFQVLGVVSIYETSAYKVNITGNEVSNGASSNEFLIAWISTSTGQVIQTYDNEVGYLQGQSAEQENSVLTMFTTFPWLSMLNSSTAVQSGSTQQITMGSVNLNVVTYHSLSGFSEFQNWIVVVGSLNSSGLQLVLSSSFYSQSTGDQSMFQLLSLTQAS